MKKWGQKYWELISVRLFIIVGLFVIVVVPIIVYGLSVIPILPAGENNDWAGFWGGYLGSIVGGIVSFLILYITIKHENMQNENEIRIQFYNKIIEDFAEYQKSVGNICAYVTKYFTYQKEDYYEKVIIENNSISALSTKIQLMLETRKEKYDLENLISIFEKFEKVFDLFLEKFEKKELSRREADLESDKILIQVTELTRDVQSAIKIKLNEKMS